ncbi:MAG: glycosyltransferase family 87 protein [Pseudomonadota bacterium]
MRAFLEWLDAEFSEDRAKVMAVCGLLPFVMVASFVMWKTIFVQWNGGYVFGFDFSSFWAAAKLAVAGNAEWAFDIERFDPLQDLAGKLPGKLYWHYPPTWVTLLYPLGYLTPSAALIVFVALTTAVWVLCVRLMIPGGWTNAIAVLLCPAAYLNFVGGQNGTLVAGALCLFIYGVLHRKDWMIVLACTLLLAKPHFGVLMPVVLIALGRWRAFGLAAFFGSAFLVFSIWLTGLAYLEAFLGNVNTVASAIKGEQLLRMQHSAYAFVRSMGLGQTASLSLQIPIALIAIAACWIAFRVDRVSSDLRIAVFLIGSVMISPYAFQYDLPVAAIGMWFLHKASRYNPVPGQNVVLAMAWFFPILGRALHTQTDISFLFVPLALLAAVTIVHLGREAFTNAI